MGQAKGYQRGSWSAAVTPDEERWAEALAIEQLHDDRALVWIAERIGALALAGDVEGVERFRQIAKRLNELRCSNGSGKVPVES